MFKKKIKEERKNKKTVKIGRQMTVKKMQNDENILHEKK